MTLVLRGTRVLHDQTYDRISSHLDRGNRWRATGSGHVTRIGDSVGALFTLLRGDGRREPPLYDLCKTSNSRTLLAT
ncbi:hypothetical protein PsYK624_101280 [Phanerochaete sordida]|uniref:Uncharacterized protein n=1 Tax=Phanerochaete sordida TaxID=48140 RepID=A0A9P3GFR6_9APHY|nr:hypothetical protein PsYK624_101280 [Phanerochaete sordida]